LEVDSHGGYVGSAYRPSGIVNPHPIKVVAGFMTRAKLKAYGLSTKGKGYGRL
jgi:hypothetical protein